MPRLRRLRHRQLASSRFDDVEDGGVGCLPLTDLAQDFLHEEDNTIGRCEHRHRHAHFLTLGLARSKVSDRRQGLDRFHNPVTGHDGGRHRITLDWKERTVAHEYRPLARWILLPDLLHFDDAERTVSEAFHGEHLPTRAPHILELGHPRVGRPWIDKRLVGGRLRSDGRRRQSEENRKRDWSEVHGVPGWSRLAHRKLARALATTS